MCFSCLFSVAFGIIIIRHQRGASSSGGTTGERLGSEECSYTPYWQPSRAESRSADLADKQDQTIVLLVWAALALALALARPAEVAAVVLVVAVVSALMLPSLTRLLLLALANS